MDNIVIRVADMEFSATGDYLSHIAEEFMELVRFMYGSDESDIEKKGEQK